MMQVSFWVFILMALAGGAGATLRWFVDSRLKQVMPALLSLGIINTFGSFFFGLGASMLAATAATTSSTAVAAIVGTGLLGGFTTFSTVMVEVMKEATGRRRGGVLLLGTVGMLAVACLAFVAGLLLGGTFGR